MSEQWGPWIDWDGWDSCPINNTAIVMVELNFPWSCDAVKEINKENRFAKVHTDYIFEYLADPKDKWGKGNVRVTRYRIRKPRGLSILTAILREVESDVDKVYTAPKEYANV